MEHTRTFQSASLRALGLVDLSPLSKTAGCCDRSYWHYQDGKGFPVGSFQSAMFAYEAAACLFPDATAHDQAADLALNYWAKRIASRSALDEYFAGQKSFCATAHTTMAAALVLRSRKRRKKTVGIDCEIAVASALEWMAAQSYRPDSANQTLAARLAWDLTKTIPNPFAPPGCAEEGWLAEYGGFDLGYTLQSLDLCVLALSTLDDATKRAPYTQWTEQILNFLVFTLESHRFSPLLSSRGNPHRLLGGLQALAKGGDPRARRLEKILSEEQEPALVTWDKSDDKYFAFFHLLSLVLAANAEKAILPLLPKRPDLPKTMGRAKAPARITELKQGNLVFCALGDTRVTVSLNAGGAVYGECGGKIFAHGGYLYRNPQRLYTTAARTSYRLAEKENIIEIQIPLAQRKVSERALTVQGMFFQLALKLILGIPGIGSLFSQTILKSVTKTPRPQTVGVRTVHVTSTSVVVTDQFDRDLKQALGLVNWCVVDGHSTRLHAGFQTVLEPLGEIHARIERQVVSVSGRVTRARKYAS